MTKFRARDVLVFQTTERLGDIAEAIAQLANNKVWVMLGLQVGGEFVKFDMVFSNKTFKKIGRL